jgi:hypothetical protein
MMRPHARSLLIALTLAVNAEGHIGPNIWRSAAL